ncbi:alpha/beta hydrolase [Rhodobacter sp. KR11]|nr:alpha/beta hydrolase [Rhodobacter sp. KR11]
MMCDHRMWGVIPLTDVIHMTPTGSSMSAMAAQVLAAAPPRFALAGLSMGGILAMEVLRLAPERVERLALFDTNPLAEAPEVQARRALQITRSVSDLGGLMTDTLIPNYFAKPQPKAEALCLQMALDLGPRVFAEQSLALRDRRDQQATLAAYPGPALVLMGEHDRLCPRDRHDLMARLLPRSKLVILPGAGHIPPLETPGLFTNALKDWLC